MRSVLIYCDSVSSLPDLVNSAFSLKKAYGSALSFAYISENPNSESKAIKEQLKELFRNQGAQESEIKLLTRKGKPYTELPLLARELHVETLLMRPYEKKGFQLFKENTSYNAVISSPCPVITLAEGVKISSFKNILLPIDTSAETRQKIPFAIHIAKHYHSVVHVVGFGKDKNNKEAYSKLKNYAEQSRGFLREKGINSEAHVEFGNNTLDMIREFIRSNDCDLLIITVDEDTSLFSSTSEKLVYSSSVPVVCIQPKDLKVSWAGL
jgi:nucleotide-binding universal stress UspA family protein